MTKLFISKMMVLKSAAGYYYGRLCIEDDCPQPYSREGGYFRTEEAAQYWLEQDYSPNEIETMEEFNARYVLKKRLNKNKE